MSDKWWRVFAETGEPMCYLLCRVEETELRPAKEHLDPAKDVKDGKRV